MTVTTRQHVTDVFATPVRNAEVATVEATVMDAPPVRTDPPPVRTLFTRVVPVTGEELDDPVRTGLQALINEKYHCLCVCSPNRSDMLAADAEMKAHPGYAAYKARRDAVMHH